MWTVALGILIAAASPMPAPSHVPGNVFPPGAHAALKCGRLIVGVFASVAEGSAAGQELPAATPTPPGRFVPQQFAAGPGTLILRDGTFDPDASPWRGQPAGVPAQRLECELDVDDGSGEFRTRYVVTGAAPVSIEPDPARGPTGVSRVILRHDGIALLLF